MTDTTPRQANLAEVMHFRALVRYFLSQRVPLRIECPTASEARRTRRRMYYLRENHLTLDLRQVGERLKFSISGRAVVVSLPFSPAQPTEHPNGDSPSDPAPTV